MSLNQGQSTVLILGIEMRSGTNYLYDLLGRHSQCALSTDISEDFLVAESAYLTKYVSVIWSFWKNFKPSSLRLSSSLDKVECMIHNIIADNAPGNRLARVIVSKTPCVVGLEQLPILFRNTKVLLLIRDGRSVTYSLERSFGCSFFGAISRWQRGAQKISAFMLSNPLYFRNNCLLIRYEDLFKAPAQELSRCFEFLGLDKAGYDYNYACNSDVIGSSDLRSAEASVHWSPVRREASFSPLERYRHWPKWKQKVASVILRRELSGFGYQDYSPARHFLPSAIIKLAYSAFLVARLISLRQLRMAVKSKLLGQEILEQLDSSH
jgi:hypothetical protein